MKDEILPIFPPKLPYNNDDKIFCIFDEEGEQIGEPYSYNDYVLELEKICGFNDVLLGQKTPQ